MNRGRPKYQSLGKGRENGWYILKYNPFHPAQVILQALPQFLLTTSGTNMVFGNAFQRKIDFTGLQLMDSTNHGFLYCDQQVLATETTNIEARGGAYEFDTQKRSFFSALPLVSIGDEELGQSGTYVDDDNDRRPILGAQHLDGIALVADYHEAAEAYYHNVPFAYLLDVAEIEKVRANREQGERRFRADFFERIRRLTVRIRT